MIVVVSFFTQFLCYGSPLAVGVLYVEWLDGIPRKRSRLACKSCVQSLRLIFWSETRHDL